MSKTKRIVLLSLLTSFAIVVYVIEAHIPPLVPIPGVKLGISNMVSLATLLIFGPLECLSVLILRIILGSLLTGSLSSFFFSLTGGLLSNLGMIILYSLFKKSISSWTISVVGSILHNIGQLSLAGLIIQNLKIYYYLPILLVSGVITGFFVGHGANFIVKYLKPRKNL